MYEAVMFRKSRTLKNGFYIKKFKDLESLADYLMSSTNSGRFYRLRNLTDKEKRILNSKTWAIYDRNQSWKQILIKNLQQVHVFTMITVSAAITTRNFHFTKIVTVCANSDSISTDYRSNETITDDIINHIRRYYMSGRLYENHEVKHTR